MCKGRGDGADVLPWMSLMGMVVVGFGFALEVFTVDVENCALLLVGASTSCTCKSNMVRFGNVHKHVYVYKY